MSILGDLALKINWKKLAQRPDKRNSDVQAICPIPPLAITALVLMTVIDEPNSTDTFDQSFSIANYRQLAELRFRIRQYLQFSEQVARTYGLEPQQHQLMLAVKGLPANAIPTVSALANRLCLRHHSTVELINRLVERGAAVRKPSTLDRRQVLVELTPLGEELLEKLNLDHSSELQLHAPELLGKLTEILGVSTADDQSASSGAVSSDSSHAAPKKLEAASF